MRRYVRNGHALDRSRYVHKIGGKWYVAKRLHVSPFGAYYAVPTLISYILGSASSRTIVIGTSNACILRENMHFQTRESAVRVAAMLFGFREVT